MASFIEAESLSSITQLAGNPPKYPRNPTEQKRSALVLYIARVPGSRDIILTTLKPRLKNVTFEDVASSLYYLHLDLPADNMLESQESDNDGMRAPARDAAIHRKPLPEDPPTRRLVNSSPPPQPPQPDLDFRQEQAQHMLASKDQNPDSIRHPLTPVYRKPLPQVPEADPRRPLGPRPNLTPSQANRRVLLEEENLPSYSLMLQPDANSPKSRTPAYRTNSNQSSEREEPGLVEALSITIIRRDLTSGAQWNIGKIRNQQPSEQLYSAPEERSRRDKSSQTYLVHLDTLGYGKFRGSRVNSDLTDDGTTTNIQDDSSITAPGFDRAVRMEGASFWERTFKGHQRGSSDQSESRGKSRLRSNSDLSSSLAPEDQYLDQDVAYKTQGRGYVFMSPWNGRCEFTTGFGGRSLKCKHRLENPPKAATSITYSQESTLISELRFNLPSAAVFDNRRSTSPTKPQHLSHTRQSPLKHFRDKLSGSKQLEDESKAPDTSYAAMYPHDDDDQGIYDRLDLSLGQEKAGGGSRGTRAKLGKLIVHDEGLKMLDLVVATNMAVWWGIWEK